MNVLGHTPYSQTLQILSDLAELFFLNFLVKTSTSFTQLYQDLLQNQAKYSRMCFIHTCIYTHSAAHAHVGRNTQLSICENKTQEKTLRKMQWAGFISLAECDHFMIQAP